MDTTTLSHALLTPPMPPMADDSIGGFGVLKGIRRNAFEAFPARCWQEPVVRVNTPLNPVVIISSPEAIRHVMLDCHRDYVRMPVGRRVLGPIVGKGLLVSEGESWRNQRHAMAPAFTPQKVQALTGLIHEVAERACTEMESRRALPQDLFTFFQAVSLDIGASVMFSTDVSSIGAELRRLLTFYMTRIGSPSVSDFLLPSWMPTVLSARRAVFRHHWQRLLASTIAQRRARARAPAHGNGTQDLFDLLEQAHGERPDDLLADEVSTMLVAGHETTALTLFWATVLLAHSPQIQSELAGEAAAFDWDARGTALDLTKLPLTKAVIQETLRLYSPAFMTARLAARTHTVGGVQIPSGAMLLVPFWLLHRHPQRWASPACFDPWRFLRGPQPGRFDYLPFGVGPRVCIGAQLAISEAVIVLARLLRDNRIAPMRDDIPLPVGKLSTRPSFLPEFVVSAR
ncbi:cytochrome P450 [Paraburkholderia sp. J67]|uniref:cytochrome P450 n=1 Tax=Paraburkholderia sp. J67 TaxID=2805435 RepID=UPI002ABE2AF1|nr:cytochrome P450 [Paraburkholderia sp. J67]